ncbi:MAG: tRNA (adenosine(37)-N6)-threonylcarbamoyltransferase complex dimerization subunit type 1 TsaB [Syntrophomonadaceae bacterium]|nr:tRNA (adenosine(37)-N6)-threonylcarbamoyltransferase complex dimerization subunit type 1 TsaB [Syntrophomonadaceae bacterium]
MLVLAIDSATPVAGVALVAEDRVLKEVFLNHRQTHSQTLMVMVDEVLKQAEVGLKDIDGIAVSRGPGSFTGLRIGLATAKGLAMGSAKPLVGVPTLDALAYNMCLFEGIICPVLDARKQEVYTAFYRGLGTGVERLSEYRACSPQALVDEIQERGVRRVAMLGDGALRYPEFFQQALGSKLVWPPPNLLLPRASSLGLLALERLRQGQYDDVMTLVPVYVRLSEAENRLRLGAV